MCVEAEETKKNAEEHTLTQDTNGATGDKKGCKSYGNEKERN